MKLPKIFPLTWSNNNKTNRFNDIYNNITRKDIISDDIPMKLKKIERNHIIIRKASFKHNPPLRFSIGLNDIIDVNQQSEYNRKKQFLIPVPKNKFPQINGKSIVIINDRFHKAISSVLIIAQCFAVMPIIGVTSENAIDLKFKWKSFRTFYSLIVTIFIGLYMIITILAAFIDKSEFDKFVSAIFYASIFLGMIFFGRLASKWSVIMQKWEIVENELPLLQKYLQKQKSSSTSLNYQIKRVTIIILSLSLIEHILSSVTILYVPPNCPAHKDPVKDFFQSQLSQLFRFTSYSLEKAIIGKLINTMSTFMWSYMDLFIIIISIGLSTNFKRINNNLMNHKSQQMPEIYWLKSRTNYRNICELCETVDKALSKIILISFANNLFFICVQLLRSLHPRRSAIHTLYFWFSLIYLISRTLAVSLYAARIHDESKKPIGVFRAVPRESWCTEVKRFCDEVTNDLIALSGMNFFYITRKLVLSVAGTIVTYELVLIQFGQGDQYSKNDC